MILFTLGFLLELSHISDELGAEHAVKTAFSAALCFNLLQQREMREPERASYSPGHSIITSEVEDSSLLTHREEKGTVEAPVKKIIKWRAEDLTPEAST